MKTNLESEIEELRESVKKLQDIGPTVGRTRSGGGGAGGGGGGGGGSFLHLYSEEDVENLKLRVEELTNANRQLRVQQIQRDTNQTLLKSEITQLKLDLDVKEFGFTRQKETHEAYVVEQVGSGSQLATPSITRSPLPP